MKTFKKSRKRSLLCSPHLWRLGVFFGVVVVVSMVFVVSMIVDVSMNIVVVVFVVVVVDFGGTGVPCSTAPLEVGRCLCSCFDHTLEGWALSLFSFVLGAGCPKVFVLVDYCPEVFCSPGFRPPREVGGASMMPRAPAGVGKR